MLLGARPRARLVRGALVIAAASGCSDSTKPDSAAEIVVTPGSARLENVSAAQPFRASIVTADGDTVHDAWRGTPVAWSSSDTAVVVVSDNGVARAVGNGSAQVRARAAGLEAAADVEVSVPGLPASVVAHVGDDQRGGVGGVLALAPAVLVRDALSEPVAGATVTFTVGTAGGHVARATAATNADGIATAGEWTLGEQVGRHELVATVVGSRIGGNPVTFVATAVEAGPPASVTPVRGLGQTGLAGYPLNVSPAVAVRDAANIPVRDATVVFSVVAGGGTVRGETARTDRNGVAAVEAWSIGLGENTLSAAVVDAGAVGTPVTFGATGVESSYRVEVRFQSPVSATQRAAFERAAARWGQIVYGDVPDVPLQVPAGSCPGTPALNEAVDDLIIFASVGAIDGAGGILAGAGPCVVRTLGRLPVMGLMQFDVADLNGLEAIGLLEAVVLHEMGHVLGFGSLWGPDGLNLLVNPSMLGGADPYFTGPQAIAAFDRIGGAAYTRGAKVPVENVGGAGTRDAHWRESVLGLEMMTGFLNPGAANPLSRLSAAAMGDLGYQVNYGASDQFSFAASLRALQRPAAPALVLERDVLRIPVHEVDHRGRIVRVYEPR